MTQNDEDRAPDRRETEGAEGAGERLHKFLASTGAGSRRECETFIAQGRVSVNGQVVSKMGVKVDPERDTVLLDGERVRPQSLVYYLVNKPVGHICTNADERGRPRVVDLVPEARRVYTVGRLDAESTGLILLTNDGQIANVVCHPRYRIEKRYQVVIRGHVTRAQLARAAAGVWLAEGRSSPARVHPVGYNPKRDESVLEIVILEGRNREIRRVFAKVGLHVKRLRRTHVGPLEIGELPPGAWRKVDPRDLGFIADAERMYLANKEAWDAELPPERPRPKRALKRGPRKSPAGKGPVGALPARGHRRAGGRAGGPSGGARRRARAAARRAAAPRRVAVVGVRTAPERTRARAGDATRTGTLARRRTSHSPRAPREARGPAQASRRARGDLPRRRTYNPAPRRAPLAQRIEHRPPEPGIGVRFP